MVIVLVNVFLAILGDAYAKVKEEVDAELEAAREAREAKGEDHNKKIDFKKIMKGFQHIKRKAQQRKRVEQVQESGGP